LSNAITSISDYVDHWNELYGIPYGKTIANYHEIFVRFAA